MVAEELKQAKTLADLSASRTARVFKDLRHRTFDSWSRERRVAGKAEWTNGEADPRLGARDGV